MYSHVYYIHCIYCKFSIVVRECSVHMRLDGEMALLSSVDVHVLTLGCAGGDQHPASPVPAADLSYTYSTCVQHNTHHGYTEGRPRDIPP